MSVAVHKQIAVLQAKTCIYNNKMSAKNVTKMII